MGAVFHSTANGEFRPIGASANQAQPFTLVPTLSSNFPPTVLFGQDTIEATELNADYVIVTEEDTDTYLTGIYVLDEDFHNEAPQFAGQTSRTCVDNDGRAITCESYRRINNKMTVKIRAYVESPERTPIEHVLWISEVNSDGDTINTEALEISGRCLCSNVPPGAPSTGGTSSPRDNVGPYDWASSNGWPTELQDDINYKLSLLKFRAPPDFVGTIFLEFTANDNGNAGHAPANSGTPGIFTRRVRMVVMPKNDDPRFVMSVDPNGLVGTEGVTLPVVGVRMDDPDVSHTNPMTKSNALSAIDRISADGKTKATAGASCKSILAHFKNSSPTGEYFLKIGKGGKARRVFCDMDTDGGGWALLGVNLGGGSSDSRKTAAPPEFFDGIGDPDKDELFGEIENDIGVDWNGRAANPGWPARPAKNTPGMTWSHPLMGLSLAAGDGKSQRTFDLATTVMSKMYDITQGTVKDKTARAQSSTRIGRGGSVDCPYTFGVLRFPGPEMLFMTDTSLHHQSPLSVLHKCDVMGQKWDRRLSHINAPRLGRSPTKLGLAQTYVLPRNFGAGMSPLVWYWSTTYGYLYESNINFKTTYCNGHSHNGMPLTNDVSTVFWFRETDQEERVTPSEYLRKMNGEIFQNNQQFPAGAVIPVVQQTPGAKHVKWEADLFVKNTLVGGVEAMVHPDSMPWSVRSKSKSTLSTPDSLDGATGGKAVMSETFCGKSKALISHCLNPWIFMGSSTLHKPAVLTYQISLKRAGTYRLFLRRSLFDRVTYSGGEETDVYADEQYILLPESGEGASFPPSFGFDGKFQRYAWRPDDVGTNVNGVFGFDKTDRTYSFTSEHIATGPIEVSVASANRGFALDQLLLVIDEPGGTEDDTSASVCHLFRTSWVAGSESGSGSFVTGSTTPGKTQWQTVSDSAGRPSTNTMWVEIDTSSANFGETPLYFASISAVGSKILAEQGLSEDRQRSDLSAVLGTSVIYASSSSSFRMYLGSNDNINGLGMSAAEMNARGWHVQWMAVPKASAAIHGECSNLGSFGNICGRLTDSHTFYNQDGSQVLSKTMKLEVFINSGIGGAPFESDVNSPRYVIPNFFVSIRSPNVPEFDDKGNMKLGRLVGGNTVVDASHTGFTLKLLNPDGVDPVGAQQLQSKGWNVAWAAFDTQNDFLPPGVTVGRKDYGSMKFEEEKVTDMGTGVASHSAALYTHVSVEPALPGGGIIGGHIRVTTGRTTTKVDQMFANQFWTGAAKPNSGRAELCGLWGQTGMGSSFYGTNFSSGPFENSRFSLASTCARSAASTGASKSYPLAQVLPENYANACPCISGKAFLPSDVNAGNSEGLGIDTFSAPFCQRQNLLHVWSLDPNGMHDLSSLPETGVIAHLPPGACGWDPIDAQIQVVAGRASLRDCVEACLADLDHGRFCLRSTCEKLCVSRWSAEDGRILGIPACTMGPGLPATLNPTDNPCDCPKKMPYLVVPRDPRDGQTCGDRPEGGGTLNCAWSALTDPQLPRCTCPDGSPPIGGGFVPTVATKITGRNMQGPQGVRSGSQSVALILPAHEKGHWIVGYATDGISSVLKMVKIKITSASTYDWVATKFWQSVDGLPSECQSQATFTISCWDDVSGEGGSSLSATSSQPFGVVLETESVPDSACPVSPLPAWMLPDYGDNTHGIRWQTPCASSEIELSARIRTQTDAEIVLQDSCSSRVQVSPTGTNAARTYFTPERLDLSCYDAQGNRAWDACGGLAGSNTYTTLSGYEVEMTREVFTNGEYFSMQYMFDRSDAGDPTTCRSPCYGNTGSNTPIHCCYSLFVNGPNTITIKFPREEVLSSVRVTPNARSGSTNNFKIEAKVGGAWVLKSPGFVETTSMGQSDFWDSSMEYDSHFFVTQEVRVTVNEEAEGDGYYVIGEIEFFTGLPDFTPGQRCDWIPATDGSKKCKLSSRLMKGRDLTLRGPYSFVRRCLANFSYYSDQDFTCADELALSVDDLRGGSTEEYLNVETILVNDPPIANAIRSLGTTCEMGPGANSCPCPVGMVPVGDHSACKDETKDPLEICALWGNAGLKRCDCPGGGIPEGNGAKICLGLARMVEDDPDLALPGFTISDRDADAYPVEIFLEVEEVMSGESLDFTPSSPSCGSLTLGRKSGEHEDPSQGLLFMRNTTKGPTSSLHFRAPLAAANAALSWIRFRPRPDWYGLARITLVVNDQGNYPGMIEWAQPQTVNVFVQGINDPPSIVLGNKESVSMLHIQEGAAVWLLRDRFPNLNVVDVDRNDLKDNVRAVASMAAGDGLVSFKFSTGADHSDQWLGNNLCPTRNGQQCPMSHPAVGTIETTIDTLVPVLLRALHYAPNPTNIHFAGRAIVNLTVFDLAPELLGGTTTVGLSDTVQVHVQVEAVADQPKFGDCEHLSSETRGGKVSVKGNEDEPIDLCMSIDFSPYENVTIFARPQPYASTFNHGRLLKTDEATGETTWIIRPKDVSTLKLQTPKDWHGGATVHYHGRSLEPSNGNVAEGMWVQTVNVSAVNDPLRVFVPPPIKSNEDGWILIHGIGLADRDLVIDEPYKDDNPNQFVQRFARLQLETNVPGSLLRLSFEHVDIASFTFRGALLLSGNPQEATGGVVDVSGPLRSMQSLLRGGVSLRPPSNYANVFGEGDGMDILPGGLLILTVRGIDQSAEDGTSGQMLPPDGDVVRVDRFVNIVVRPVNDFPVLHIGKRSYQETESLSDRFFDKNPDEYLKFAGGSRRLGQLASQSNPPSPPPDGTKDLPFICTEDSVCQLSGIYVSDVDDANDRLRSLPIKPFRLRVLSSSGTVSLAKPSPTFANQGEDLRFYQGSASNVSRHVDVEVIGTLYPLNGLLSTLTFRGNDDQHSFSYQSGTDSAITHDSDGLFYIDIFVEDMCCPNSSSTVATIQRRVYVRVLPGNDPPSIGMEVFSDRDVRRAKTTETYQDCSFNQRLNRTACFNRTRSRNEEEFLLNGTSYAENANAANSDSPIIVHCCGREQVWLQAQVVDDAVDFDGASSNDAVPRNLVHVSLSCEETFGHFNLDTSGLALTGIERFTHGGPLGSARLGFISSVESANAALEMIEFVPETNSNYNRSGDTGDMHWMSIALEINDMGSGSGNKSSLDAPSFKISLAVDVGVNRSLDSGRGSGDDSTEERSPLPSGIDAALSLANYTASFWEDTRISLFDGVSVRTREKDVTVARLDVSLLGNFCALVSDIPTSLLPQLQGVIVTGGASSSLAFTAVGTQDQLTLALRYLFLDSNKDYNGPVVVRFQVTTDTPTAVFSSAPLAKTFNLLPVNDAPYFVSFPTSSTFAAEWGGDAVVSTFSVKDADVLDPASHFVQLACSVTTGTLRLLVEQDHNTTWDGTTLVFQKASMRSINKALEGSGIVYTPPAEPFDVSRATFPIMKCTVNDLGNHGAGGPRQSIATVTIHMRPVPREAFIRVTRAINGFVFEEVSFSTVSVQLISGTLKAYEILVVAWSGFPLGSHIGAGDALILGEQNASSAAITYLVPVADLHAFGVTTPAYWNGQGNGTFSVSLAGLYVIPSTVYNSWTTTVDRSVLLQHVVEHVPTSAASTLSFPVVVHLRPVIYSPSSSTFEDDDGKIGPSPATILIDTNPAPSSSAVLLSPAPSSPSSSEDNTGNTDGGITPSTSMAWKEACRDEASGVLCAGYGKCQRNSRECSCRKGFAGSKCTEEVEVLEVKVDKDFDDVTSTPDRREAFENEFKDEVSDRLKLGDPERVEILELREGSVVVTFQVLLPKEETKTRLDALTAPLVNDQVGDVSIVAVDRVQRNEDGEEIHVQRDESGGNGASDNTNGGSGDGGTTPVIIGSVLGGVGAAALIAIVLFLVVRRQRSREGGRKRTKKAKSHTLSDQDGIELMPGDDRWSTSRKTNTFNPLAGGKQTLQRAETVYTMNAMYNGGGGGNSSAAAGLSADSGGVGGNGGGDGGGSQSIPEIKIEASLPDAWEALESGDGQTYYHHKSSGQTQWTKPHP
jgi:hypothetical protein